MHYKSYTLHPSIRFLGMRESNSTSDVMLLRHMRASSTSSVPISKRHVLPAFLRMLEASKNG